MTAVLLSVIAVVPLVASHARDTSPATDVRQAIERSLPFLELEGTNWITERKCISCHVVAFMVWSHNEAKVRGLKVDAKKLDEWNGWTLDYSLAARQWFKLTDDSTKQLKTDGVPEVVLAKLKPMLNEAFVTDQQLLDKLGKSLTAEELEQHKAALLKRANFPKAGEKNDGGSMATMGQLLLGRSADASDKLTRLLESAPVTMRKWQETNGSWKATGQLFRQNRPGAENDETTTGWALLGLASLKSNDPATSKSIDTALAYFRKTKVGKSHESLLVHLLVEDKFGKPDDTEKLLQDVLKRQNADGGWAWAPGNASDAFATGQTLYALSSIATKPDSAAVRRAQKYLVESQGKDGAWVVPPKAISDPKATEARVEKVVPIYNFWGTAWASIGLSRSLGTTDR